MKPSFLQALAGSAAMIAFVPGCHGHLPHHQKHRTLELKRQHHLHSRGSACPFPTDDNTLVAITPHAKNAGWAMSPDQECKPGNYCPIACKPGMVMAQWDPESSYSYPASMNGGLFCDENGKIHKPFPDKPYCVPGTGAVKVVNKCEGKMSWCQTVLPGNEAMLIPTVIEDEAVIAVPDVDYWSSTAAHFYVNPPGSGSTDCKWGDSDSPIGNWSPFVAGANTDNNGQTFIKLGWNPIWEASVLKSSRPEYGLRVECPQGGCTGLPCEIHPAQPQGHVESKLAAVGAGNSAFCVVTVSQGKKAHVVAFSHASADPKPLPSKVEPPPPPPSTSKTPTPTPNPTPTSTSSVTPSSTHSTTTSVPVPSTTKPTSTSTVPSTTSIKSTSMAPTTSSSTSMWTTTQIKSTTSLARPSTTTSRVHTTLAPAIFHDNGTSSETLASSVALGPPTVTPDMAPPKNVKDGHAGRLGASGTLTGVVAALVGVACIL